MKIEPFETSFGIVQNRRILLVETIADGVSGWGDVTAGETPGYNAEATETAWHVLSDFIAPSIIGKNILDASEFPALMSHIRGHENGEERRGECSLGRGSAAQGCVSF